MASEAQKAARKKWDAENMDYQSVKVRRKLLEQFKATCKSRGDKVNTVLRKAMEQYIVAIQDDGNDAKSESNNR